MKKISISRALADDIVAASRILAQQGVLDAYGHVSARSDREPEPLHHVALARTGPRHRATT